MVWKYAIRLGSRRSLVPSKSLCVIEVGIVNVKCIMYVEIRESHMSNLTISNDLPCNSNILILARSFESFQNNVFIGLPNWFYTFDVISFRVCIGVGDVKIKLTKVCFLQRTLLPMSLGGIPIYHQCHSVWP